MTNEEYEVVTYNRAQTVLFNDLKSEERYLEMIKKMDTDNVHFVELDGVAIK